jgi:hypothetical protein
MSAVDEGASKGTPGKARSFLESCGYGLLVAIIALALLFPIVPMERLSLQVLAAMVLVFALCFAVAREWFHRAA